VNKEAEEEEEEPDKAQLVDNRWPTATTAVSWEVLFCFVLQC
jgi:hypothetical protein